VVATILEAIAAFPLSAWLRTSFVAYPLVSALHILGAGGLVTLVWLMHRAGGRNPENWGRYRRLAAAALAVMVVSGLALFSVKPVDYAANPAFLIKMALIVLALANIAIYEALPASRHVTAVVSVAVWPGVLVAGRFVGFV
tara:strand:+ start:594 stop:1016 length:423 start_codon:yes stop_codon:yes gene_type:complete